MQDIIAQRVEAVRQWLNVQQLDAIIIPHEDEFLGEYVPAHNERLHWLTGFTGSAGAAVITHDKAAILLMGVIPFKSLMKYQMSYLNTAT